MTLKVSSWRKRWRSFSGLALIAASIAFGGSAFAQNRIVPDDTLEDDNSQVRSNVEVDNNPAEIIEGGARRGTNLFHSFTEFNVESGRGAYFSNPPEVERIFSRVTGSNVSEIFGTLGVSGNADLFLINPNGIVFGENARLDLNGSFLGSTASSVLFEEFEFSAAQPESPLLTINVPLGLNFQNNPGSITNRSTASNTTGEVVGLSVNPGNSVTLLGGEIDFDAGNLTAKAGNLRLGGLATAGTIGIAGDGSLSFPQNVDLADITLSNGADIDVRGNRGNIAIDASNLTLQAGEPSLIRAGIENNSNSDRAGDITIGAAGNITIDRGSILNSVENDGVGNAGKIDLTAENLTLTNGGRISASSFGRGNAGLVNVTARDTIVLDGENSLAEGSRISSVVNEQAIGDSERVTINAKNLYLSNGSVVVTSTLGQGNAGDISINARDITLNGTTSENVPSSIASLTSLRGVGNAGDIKVSTGNLTLTDGGLITAATFGRGDAGFVDIAAQGRIFVDGTTSEITQIPTSIDGLVDVVTPELFQLLVPDDFAIPSSINSVVFVGAVGNAGGVNISTSDLILSSGGEISASTFGRGNAGGVNINATESIFIDGETENRTGISANALSFAGNGGNVEILTNRLAIEDNGRIEVSNFDSSGLFGSGRGQPGNINIRANSVALTNGARIDAATQATSGIGGVIDLEVKRDITLRDNSSISARASDDASGGNLNIDTQFIVAAPQEDNDITANATEGDGGNIDIDAQSIFGIEQRTAVEGNGTSDIDASSEFGLSGTVEINTPDVDRDRDLVQLPERPIETEIKQVCDPNDTRSSFTIKGSGGLPPSPEATLNSDAIDVDWVSRPPQSERIPASISTDSIPDRSAPLIEAQGWIVDENNELVLVANNYGDLSWQNSPQCTSQSLHYPSEPKAGREPNRRTLIASTQPQLDIVPEQINIERFEIEGNQAFDSEELTQVLAPFSRKPLSFSELLQARSAITEYYTERGYITSGAYIPPQKLRDNVLKIQVVEGYLEDIEVTGNKRLDSDYISRRIETAAGNSLQREKLLAALQLLQQNPLTDGVSAELEAGTRPGASVLTVEVTEADSFTTPILFDNRRNPSVGSFRRQLAINEGNLLGFGDNLSLAYSNTEGSDAFDGSYSSPFNARNGTVTLSGGLSASEVVEAPFNQLDILGDSHYYELSLRQPLKRTPTQEFALGVTASRRNSDISSLLEEFDIPPSELSPGADERGETRVSALRFFQEWTSRSDRQVIAARSQFNLGLGIFDATVNNDAPDSKFFSWQGQAQWTRQLATDTLFILRGGVQLTPTSLLSSEQFGLGGLSTVRGYRQDLLLRDSAAFASAEVRLPIFRFDRANSVVQLAPFFDLGTAGNKDDAENSEPNTLASIGLGLRFLISNITAKVDWGIPLISVSSEKKSWQENGLYFSVEYSPF